MSLELALKENTEALLAHTAALKELLGTTSSVAASTGTSASTSDDDASTAETPKRERGKPSAGKSKRTAAEVAEDKAADEADAAAAAGKDGGDDDTGAEDGVTFDGVKTKLGTWLGEFAKEEDKENPDGAHPEVLARKAALKAVLNTLAGNDKGTLGAIKDDAEKIGKLDNWFETKAKVADKGFGVGRLAADPEPAGDDEGGDDELDI